MTFHVGQKVVCVDDSPNRLGEECPVKRGPIYIVSDVGMAWDGPYLNIEGVRLARQYFGFAVERFRPIVEKKTDISIFTAMLNPNERVAPLVGDRTGVSKKAEVA